jgi:hypothetical protein
VEAGHETGASVGLAGCYEINESLVESLSCSFIGGIWKSVTGRGKAARSSSRQDHQLQRMGSKRELEERENFEVNLWKLLEIFMIQDNILP